MDLGDVYAFQGGKAIHEERNDEKLSDYMNEHKDEGHVTGYEPIDDNETINEVKRIYSEAEKEIEEKQKAIAILEAEIKKYESYDFASEEDKYAAINKKQAEISGHNKNINNIVEKRDLDVKKLLSRSPKEKVNDMQRKQGDARPQKSRWESAAPNNPSDS